MEYLEHTYRKALTGIAAKPPRRMKIAEAYQRAPLLPWSGRGKDLDLRTYQAVLAFEWEFGHFSVPASTRDLALHANASRYGISNALGRLVDQGLLKECGQHEDSRTTIWKALIPCANNAIGHTKYVSMDLSRSMDSRGSMDPCSSLPFLNLERIFLGLDTTPRSALDLAAITGLSRYTTARILRQLESFGLAVATASTDNGRPTGWIRGEKEFGEVFDSRKEDGRRREQFQRDRERWQESRARWDAAKKKNVVVLRAGGRRRGRES
jgi:hypothetical protein